MCLTNGNVTSTMDPSDAFSLIFTNDTRVGGQTAAGTIILNVPLLKIAGIKEVHLNLRGLVITYATPPLLDRAMHLAQTIIQENRLSRRGDLPTA